MSHIEVLKTVNAYIWGVPLFALILLTGIFLSIGSKVAQLRLLPKAMGLFLKNLKTHRSDSAVTDPYRALCTALAATVGTGNIAGVAGAIALGGPGAVFWMWISGILGMIIKFAEVTLAMRYRTKDREGNYIGGPMYMIRFGLPDKMGYLSWVYCFMGVLAAFGMGNAAQINAVTDGLKSIALMTGTSMKTPAIQLTALTLTGLLLFAFRNGTKRIGSWTEKLVPFAALSYIILAAAVLCCCFREIPSAVHSIITNAFTPEAATGGAVGSFCVSARVGLSRGIFTNEAGMGTASVAHASANTLEPVEQGFLGIIEVFLDTIVLCTLTALVILCSGVSPCYGTDPGIILTLDAFSAVLGDWVKIAVTALICLFAFATVLGWGFYGIRFFEYLFGQNTWHIFVISEAIVCYFSVFAETTVIWTLSELLNAFMAIPNLIALIYLMPRFLKDIKAYKKAYRQ